MKSRVDATPLFLQDDLLKDSRIFATHYFINSNLYDTLQHKIQNLCLLLIRIHWL